MQLLELVLLGVEGLVQVLELLLIGGHFGELVLLLEQGGPNIEM